MKTDKQIIAELTARVAELEKIAETNAAVAEYYHSRLLLEGRKLAELEREYNRVTGGRRKTAN